MALPTTGAITAAMVNVELKRPAGAFFDINGAAERKLAGRPSGTISMSDFRGKSNEFILYITGHNHSVYNDWVWDHLYAMGGYHETNIRIIVNSGVQLVAADTGVRGVFNFHGGWSGKTITIENYGYILGRGGKGGAYAHNGNNGYGGGRAMYNELANVTVFNHGVIAGGGGGGGGSGKWVTGGGGGAPFGAGGVAGSSNGPQYAGGAASFDTGGLGRRGDYQNAQGGHGGNWGVNGNPFTSTDSAGQPGAGGAAGEASRGGFIWAHLGDVRGARV